MTMWLVAAPFSISIFNAPELFLQNT